VRSLIPSHGCRCVPQVDAAANRIAHYLRNQADAVAGDMIGVLVLRSPLMVAALLGVLRAGCGYLPLDHHHPEARIDFMVDDAVVKVWQRSHSCADPCRPSSARRTQCCSTACC
jgi:non-ribosomal peptide synthetase component F